MRDIIKKILHLIREVAVSYSLYIGIFELYGKASLIFPCGGLRFLYRVNRVFKHAPEDLFLFGSYIICRLFIRVDIFGSVLAVHDPGHVGIERILHRFLCFLVTAG